MASGHTLRSRSATASTALTQISAISRLQRFTILDDSVVMHVAISGSQFVAENSNVSDTRVSSREYRRSHTRRRVSRASASCHSINEGCHAAQMSVLACSASEARGATTFQRAAPQSGLRALVQTSIGVIIHREPEGSEETALDVWPGFTNNVFHR